MGKKHNLNFTDDELGIKAEKLSADVPKAHKDVKPKKAMKVKKNLKFEENKKKPSDKFKENAKDISKDMPGKIVSNTIHRKIENDSDDNSSVEAVNKGTESVQNVYRTVKTYERRRQRKVTEKSEKKQFTEERKTDRENIKQIYAERQQQIKTENPEYKSNPYSKWKQKQNIKKEYYAAKSKANCTGSLASTASSSIKSSAKKATENISEKATEYIASHKAGIFVAGGLVLALVLIMSVASSGVVMIQSGTGALGLTTYPSDDSEMLAAEDYYKNLEEILQNSISTYESTHSYNEYHYSIDPISHDPYELTSLLTAKSEDAYTAAGIKTFETTVFNAQYKLTENIVRETRYRREIRYRTVTYTDADGNIATRIESYFVDVPYYYYICYVTLKNNGMEKAADSLLTSEQKEMYEIYNETKGNREDLF